MADPVYPSVPYVAHFADGRYIAIRATASGVELGFGDPQVMPLGEAITAPLASLSDVDRLLTGIQLAWEEARDRYAWRPQQ